MDKVRGWGAWVRCVGWMLGYWILDDGAMIWMCGLDAWMIGWWDGGMVQDSLGFSVPSPVYSLSFFLLFGSKCFSNLTPSHDMVLVMGTL